MEKKPLLTIEEVAAWLHIPVSRLYQWRYDKKGAGPPALKIGHSVRYDPDAVKDWLDTNN